MIASLSDHVSKREEEKNYGELVSFYCKSIVQTRIWELMVSIANNVKQKNFSNRDAIEMIKILSSEFGVRSAGIQYLRTFSSVPYNREESRVSNVIQLTLDNASKKANNERLLIELGFAIQNKDIEYSHALSLVNKIVENYPNTEKYLHD